MRRPVWVPDNYILMLVGTVVLATLLPASGDLAVVLRHVTTVAIGLLFFLHGAKLSREAIVAGLMHWRLYLAVFACTFVLFPILGLVLRPVLEPLVNPELYLGILFLCFLPSTVQSAIALTSMARGNIPAAICCASGSTLLGVFVTPFFVGLWVSPQAAEMSAWSSIARIFMQLMLPFLVGHLMRPWLMKWMMRSGKLLTVVDRGSILLVVYTAFSAAVLQGLWSIVPVSALVGLVVICIVFLIISLGAAYWLGRAMGLDRGDQIAMMLAASQKSLASGVPMAQVLFASSVVGLMVLPLMLYHQIQLMVTAVLAQRWGERSAAEAAETQAK